MNFPDSPQGGDRHTEGGKVFEWDGNRLCWKVVLRAFDVAQSIELIGHYSHERDGQVADVRWTVDGGHLDPDRYGWYHMLCVNLRGTSDQVQLFMSMSSDGVNYDTGTDKYKWGADGDGSNSSSQMTMTSLQGNGECPSSGFTTWFGPHIVTRSPVWGVFGSVNSSNNINMFERGIVRSSSYNLQGIRVYWNSGSIGNGDILLYGWPKS